MESTTGTIDQYLCPVEFCKSSRARTETLPKQATGQEGKTNDKYYVKHFQEIDTLKEGKVVTYDRQSEIT